jgi:tetratricopeptide (TPR) repeat protein
LLATQSGFQQYQQALQLEKQGSADQAIGLYLQAAVAAPEEEFLLTGLGLAYMRLEDLVAARQNLTRASRLNSHYYHPQLGLGYIYLQQKGFVQSEEHLRRSQTLLPTALGGYFLARLLEETNDIPAALTAYRDVVRYFKGSQMGSLAEKRILVLESSHELE